MLHRIFNKLIRQNLLLIILSIFSILGICIIYYATYWGIGLYGSDSFSYISVSRSIANGLGFVFPVEDNYYAPLTHFPPFLSIVLAIFEFIGLDSLVAIRFLNALLFGSSVILFGLLIKRTTNSIIFTTLGVFFFSISAVFVELYSLAMSEGLFLTLTLLSFLILDMYIRQNGLKLLIIVSLVLGLAAITRYVGIVNIFTGILVVTLLKVETRISRKLRDIIIMGVISLAPIVLWTARSYWLTTSINNRGFEFHPLVLKNYLNMFYTFTQWYLPINLVVGYEKEIIIITAVIIIILFSFVYFMDRSKSIHIFSYWNSVVRNIHPLNKMYLVYAVTFVFAIYFSKTFFDPGTGMTNRIFSPMLMVSMLLIINTLDYFWKKEKRIFRVVVLLVVIYLLYFSISNSKNNISEIHNTGMGLGRKAFHNSKSVQILDELSSQMPIFNNNPYAMYFYTGKVGFKINKFSPIENPDDKALIAIFGSSEEYGMQERYPENIILVQSDNVATIYLYQPK